MEQAPFYHSLGKGCSPPEKRPAHTNTMRFEKRECRLEFVEGVDEEAEPAEIETVEGKHQAGKIQKSVFFRQGP
jgi:hypothetical protein